MIMAKKKAKSRKRAWRFLKIQMVLIALVLLAIAYYYIGGYASKVASLHQEAISFVASSNRDTFRSAETSVVYDASGEVISYLKGEKDVYYLTSAQIPVYAKQALVSVEDKKFYSHHGVDYKAIVRAVWAMYRNGKVTQGASTITQQLARDVFLTQDKTWERKIEEIYIAVELEKKYSKEDILEFYVNNIYFKNGYYGLEAAAQGYFSKSAQDLSLSETAFLCAIPNNPSYYNPLEHMDHTLTRRDKILEDMLKEKVISKTSYENALAEEIVLNMSSQAKHDYVETYTYYCATRTLMELNGFRFQTVFDTEEEREAYNASYEEAYNQWNASLFTGGYRIYTSLDLSMQQTLQDALDKGLSKFTEKSEEGIYTLQGAAVCIDNSTGMVRAIVGGRSQEVEGYTLNRGFQSYRQPGSSIKPILVYTPMLERGYTADSIVYDGKIEDGPSNADGTYLGNITLRRAVELSRNTVAWRLFEELTPEVGFSYLETMNFGKLDKNDIRLTSALGGLTYGVSPVEMAKAYATLENDGKYRNPGCILKIEDSSGRLIYQATQEEVQVYKTNAARAMTDILEGVMVSGTAKKLGLSNMACAGKTGTTNDNKDGWFIGYTPYYTTSVWVGYDQPKELPGLMGASYPGNIWKSFMSQIHKDLERRDFLDVASVDEENVGEDTLSEQQAIVNKQKEERGLPITEYEEEEYDENEGGYDEYVDGEYDEYDDYDEGYEEEWIDDGED